MKLESSRNYVKLELICDSLDYVGNLKWTDKCMFFIFLFVSIISQFEKFSTRC